MTSDDGVDHDGWIVFYVGIGQCQWRLITAQIVDDVWYPDPSRMGGNAMICGTPDPYGGPEYAWIMDLFDNPFHVNTDNDQVVRIENGQSFIDFQWD